MMLPLNEAQCMIYRSSSKNSAPLIFWHPIACFWRGSSDLYASYGVLARAHG